MIRSKAILSTLSFVSLLAANVARAQDQPATQPAAEAQQTLQATVVDQGGTTTCTQGKNTRTVTISSSDAAKKVPCEVHYKKETGTDQVIYNSANNASFCETKAKAFVEKLGGMGWTCK